MRAPDHIKDCVMFIGTKDARGTFIPKGTAFFASITEHQLSFTYVVTAEHVVNAIANAGGEIYLRCNSKDGQKVIDRPAPRQHWVFWDQLDEHIDVALLPFNPEADGVKSMQIALNEPTQGMMGTKDILKQNHIGVGDEVIIAGLFTSHFGHDQNIPLIRIGSIAAMTDEPVKTQNYGFIDAYLIEAHSIAGLSGSPVLVSMPPYRVIDLKVQPLVKGSKQFYFLGLIQGHFDIQGIEDAVAEGNAGSAGINVGIAVVTSCDAVMRALRAPELTEQRRLGAIRYFEKHGAREDGKT